MSEAIMGGVRRLIAGDGPAQAPSAPDAWREALLDSLPAEVEAPARNAAHETTGALSPAPSPAALREPTGSAPTGALRYRVQFTADQTYVDLLKHARDLLWHQLPSGDLVELQRLALEALVDKLLRRKVGALARREPPGGVARAEPPQ